jgi:hypothetical protein
MSVLSKEVPDIPFRQDDSSLPFSGHPHYVPPNSLNQTSRFPTQFDYPLPIQPQSFPFPNTQRGDYSSSMMNSDKYLVSSFDPVKRDISHSPSPSTSFNSSMQPSQNFALPLTPNNMKPLGREDKVS